MRSHIAFALITASLAYQLSAIGAHAQQFTSGPWTYTLNAADEATVTQYRGPSGEVIIPSDLDGKPVKQIGDGGNAILGWGDTGITSVTIPNSVTNINWGAFQGSGLTSVSIPDSVTSIGGYAFSGCAGLTSVTIPDGVTSIMDGTFGYCRGLTSVTIGNAVTRIGSIAFTYCSSLTSVTIPNSVTSIGLNAFSYATALTDFSVGSGNTSYSSLNGVLFNKTATALLIYPPAKQGPYSIPDGVTSIAAYAFSQQSGLTSVTIPNTVTSIGQSAFSGCTNLQSVTMGNGVTYIGDAAFGGCSGLTNMVLPPSVYFIGAGAFNSCPKISEITIPNTVRFIGDNAFIGSPASIKIDNTALAQDPNFVAAVIAALQSYQAATKGDLTNAVSAAASNTVAHVQANPTDYNLFTLAQNEARFNEGVTTGTSLVTANPGSYNLYTSDSIMDLRMNGLMVQKQGSNAVVTFQTQTTTDLTQPFTNNGTAITNEIPMPGNKGFIRIHAKPNPTPVVN